MSKYQKGKVYKLVSNSSDLVYYGSTYNKLTKRLTGHKSDYKGYSNGKGQRYKTSYELIKLEDAQIILVEDFPCERKEQLLAQERFYIENNTCVNKNIPGRTDEEYMRQYKEKHKENLKEQNKLYREKNKDKIKEYREANKDKEREYREANKEKITKQKKEYREANKEKIKEGNKKWREQNKEYNKQYYEINKEKITKQKKEYYETNKKN